MNIKFTYKWLLEYLDTDATPQEMQEYLSLCGPGVERVDKVGDDYVFDVEVTTNRVDMASVFGFAQEATSILPQFGKKAALKVNPLEAYTFKTANFEPNHHKQLDIEIQDPSICSRFTAMIVSDVTIKESPAFMKDRLQLSDINSINNIVDISNYIMLALGQPIHMFDYDKIGQHKMIMRLSKKGEKVKTLDSKEILLPGNDIIIEDGDGRIIDLCGIMGGENSEITKDTKNIVFFVQTYDKRRVRKTSMLTGQRSVAATYFEKGLDTERVENAYAYGMKLILEHAGGVADSPLYDIYPHPYQPKTISVKHQDIERVMGVSIEKDRVENILKNLGFGIVHKNHKYEITVPSYRALDVDIKEDIIEEVARVYGYHNLPNNIQPTVYVPQPPELGRSLRTQHKLKYFLKHLGLNEVFNYSMTSEKLLKTLDLDPSLELKIANTISEEIEFMRRSLVPSLVKNIAENEGRREILRFFEIARVYHKRENDLPEEITRLGIVSNTTYSDIKGIVEAIFKELKIDNVRYELFDSPIFYPQVQAKVFIGDNYIGKIGQLKKTYQDRMEIRKPVFAAELDMQTLADNTVLVKPFQPINTFATIYIQHPVELKEQTFADYRDEAMKKSSLLQNIEVTNIDKGKYLLKFSFSSKEKNITEEDAKKELQKIVE